MKRNFCVILSILTIHSIISQEIDKNLLIQAGDQVCDCISALPESPLEDDIANCFQTGSLLLQFSGITDELQKQGKKKKKKEKYEVDLGEGDLEIEWYLIDNCERYQQLYPESKYYVLLEKSAPVACDCISTIATDISLSVKNKAIQECMIGSYRETDADPDSYPKTVEDIRLFYEFLEEILINNCEALSKVTFSDDQVNEYSYSSNEKAIEAYNKGQVAWQEQKIKKAIKYYEKAINIDPKFVFAWDNLGRAYREINKLDEAINAYKESLAIDPENRVPLMNIGIAYSYKQDWDSALMYYNLLQEYHPDDAEAPYGKALIYFNKGNLDASLENAITAYKLYEANKSPYKNDAIRVVGALYDAFITSNKEEDFHKICEENQINFNLK